MEFSGIIRLVEFSRFLKYEVDISRNLRLIKFGKFLKFRFRVRAIYYRILLFAMGGGK